VVQKKNVDRIGAAVGAGESPDGCLLRCDIGCDRVREQDSSHQLPVIGHLEFFLI